MLIKLSEVKATYAMDIKGIIHVGAHIGQEFEEYMNCLVKHVAFFEPCRDAYDKLEKKFVMDRAALGFPEVDVQLYNVALGAYKGEALMNVEKSNEGQSNSLLKPQKHLEYYPSIQFNDKELVRITRLEDVEHIKDNIAKYNMLNMDVQGYEVEVLKGAKAILPYIDYVYTEVNTQELYAGNATLDQMDAFLSDFERVKTEMTDAGWGDALYIRKTPAAKTLFHDIEEKVSTESLAGEDIGISESSYFNGMKPQDETNIYLGSGVSVTLDKNRYLLLANSMSKTLGQAVAAHQKADERYWKKAKRFQQFVEDVRNVFYEDQDDFAIKRPINEIDTSKLGVLLERVADILGFENGTNE